MSASAPTPAQNCADPLADITIAKVLGDWEALPATATLAQTLVVHAKQWERIAEVNKILGAWDSNAGLSAWVNAHEGSDSPVIAPLVDYVKAAQALPAWADPARTARAETLFMAYGALSCTLLFCSSLPECYVIPDLADVLHVAGQLEQHTEYRIRMTAAMIFPVMMKGGMSTPAGGGVAQVLKVRLIHATIRNLILRGSPEQALADPVPVPPLPGLRGTPRMHHAMFAHGWDTAADGLPCNQEELAYTLLTFGYVFLRSLRIQGLGLSSADEEDFLHAWNVVGHVLGIQDALMAHTMDQAQALFDSLQTRGRRDVRADDPRPALGQALMQTMAGVIPFRLLKPFPVLMTRYLCGAQTARDLGLTGGAAWLSKALFALFMGFTRLIDTLARLVWPEFSISRLITRVLGYHFMTRLLMDQTRPLQLPNQLLNRIDAAMESWSDDPKAPAWMNRFEDRLTTRGSWTSPGLRR